MGLGCSEFIHRRVAQDLKYGLWLVKYFSYHKKVFLVQFSKFCWKYFRYHVNGVDGEAAILRRDSFMNNYNAMRKKKESRLARFGMAQNSLSLSLKFECRDWTPSNRIPTQWNPKSLRFWSIGILPIRNKSLNKSFITISSIILSLSHNTQISIRWLDP